MNRHVLFALSCVIAACGVANAGEIPFLEDFALAKDRNVPLKTLIPGTEDYYYFQCLHLQHQGKYAEVEAVLAAWVRKFKNTPRIREMQNRQHLLRYAKNPQRTLEFLRTRLGLNLNHQKANLAALAQLPTRLDPALISRERLTSRAMTAVNSLGGFEDPALGWLIGTELNTARRRQLLSRLKRPDHRGLARLVVSDLAVPRSRGFGSLSIHRLLLKTQLDECLEFQPALLNQSNFVNIYLAKLQPGDDIDWRHDPVAHVAYLDRLWNFARRLDPVHNSLKAHVLYRRLVLDRTLGIHDKQRFLEYLKLPRNMFYVRPEFLKNVANRRHLANLKANYSPVTRLPIIGSDEKLVRSCLEHFFLREDNYRPYEPYLSDVYLKQVFAETKIMAGQGDPEQWAAMLSPAQYQQLQKRVDIEFAPHNRVLYGPDDPVSLLLDVKNVGTLIVKVFEVNANNYYRDKGREVNTDINLDGLVPNREQTFTYKEPPQRRVRRRFDVPGLDGRGTWVIDFIGNGKSSRVLIRKGKLQHLVRTSVAGHVFTVLDEAGRSLDKASIWLTGNEYHADKKGEIAVPFSTSPRRQPIILAHDGFASLTSFNHQAENYSLAAGIYVDREAVLSRLKATVVVRPSLTINGTPVSLDVLDDTRLVISSTDHDGVTTTKEVGDFKLFEDRESVYEFQVPQRLALISFVLKARVKNLSRGKTEPLAAGQSFVLNAIDKTPKVEDLHLVQTAAGYAIDVLGKTGEPVSSRPVQLVLKHRDFKQPVRATLQSAAGTGRVVLGPLDGIASFTATGPEGTAHTWRLTGDAWTYAQSIHGVAGQPLRVPWMGTGNQPRRSQLSLLELRGDNFVADRFDAIAIRGGFLELTGLSPGDHDLLLKDTGTRIRVRIAAGERRNGYVIGQSRRLEDRSPSPLQIASVTLTEQAVLVQLANATKFSRVHVFATRFQPAFSAFGHLGSVRDAEPYVAPVSRHPSLFMAGRNIGDEYRYIIDRKYLAKFPGNMLKRPSLLLNPWAIRKTTTGKQQAKRGDDFGAAMDEKLKTKKGGGAGGRRGIAAPTDFANLDFLAGAAVVQLNLRPNEKGVITIPRDALAGKHQVHVLAIDPQHTAYRRLALPAADSRPLDLRLARGLDPAGHFTQRKQITIVPADGELTIADVTSSKVEIYDSLARVYSLFTTLSKNPTLAEFRFILEWPKLEDAEKRAKYSKYACHELNFFLSKKDPDFFGEVIRPYLGNKKEKTFLDHWLLGDDLGRFRSPWSHARLNIVERVLLAQRIDGEPPRTRRHVHELFELVPSDSDRVALLFATALRGRALDADDDKKKLGLVSGRERQLARLGDGETTSKDAAPQGGGRSSFARTFGGGVKSPQSESTPKPQLASPAKAAKKGRLALDALKRSADRPGGKSNETFALRANNYFAADKALRKNVRQLFRRLDKTQEWVENNYYHVPIEKHTGALVTVNAFWDDYAAHDPAQPFFSEHFAEASRSFPEMMFALAVLDLPFEPGEHESKSDGDSRTLVPASPAIIVHREIKPAGDVADKTPVLVTQNFFQLGDRYRQVDNERVDKFVTEEFLVHTVYGCQVVLTNPTSSRQRLDVLLQVPVGALPVNGTRYTRSVHVDLAPYQTSRLEYHFYFRDSGDYRHFPVHVAKNEQVIAAAAAVTLAAVDEPSRLDRTSWAHVSQQGTRGEVLEFLRTHNLHRTDLNRIAFRMRDKQFFGEVLELLSERHVYNATLWAYGVFHNDDSAIAEFLRHRDPFVGQCGLVLTSPLLTLDPVERRTFQHMDYRPLVNSRTHQLGQRRQILNDRFHAQYRRLLAVLSYKPTLDDNDLMAVTYYMLLQDRIEDAIGFFGRVNADNLQTQLQYDYFNAYIDLFNADPKVARKVAERWLARLDRLPADGLIPVAIGVDGRKVAHPVDHWRKLFADVIGQLDEAQGDKPPAGADDEDRQQARLAASQPNFDFKVETRQVKIDYQNLESVTVSYYLMDIELLFSRNPFVRKDSSRFAHIRPNQTLEVELPADKPTHTLDLPQRFHNRNVLVELRGGGLVKSQAYYSNSLAVQVIQAYGQVRVTDTGTGKPLPKIYVKVYARTRNGKVQFYKDGYTDLRGRFAYARLNTNDLENVTKFSLLVLSDAQGAVVKEADPPKE